MNSKPFFSIVTAIKDGLPFFKQTFLSVLSQTYKDWEWIIIDDASIENIYEFLEPFIKNDKRIRYIRNEKPLRQTKSLNLGIRASVADWIVRIDADDLAAPNRLLRIFKKITESQAYDPRFIFSDYELIDELGDKIGIVEFQSISDKFFKYLERNNPICHPTVAFFKWASAANLFLYDEKLNNAQDYELWQRIARQTKPSQWVLISEPLVSYRLVRESLSGAGAAEQKQELERIRKTHEGEQLVDASNSLTLEVFDDRKKTAMQIYRELYYLFISSRVYRSLKFSDLLKTIFLPRVFLKSLFYYFAARRFKTVLFYGIYK